MKRKPSTDIPPDFTITPRVRGWALAKGYGDLEQHLEYFKLKVEANGYRYVSWDAAFCTAIRDDWAGLRKFKPAQAHQMSQQSVVERGMKMGLPPKPGESQQEYERRIMSARH